MQSTVIFFDGLNYYQVTEIVMYLLISDIKKVPIKRTGLQ